MIDLFQAVQSVRPSTKQAINLSGRQGCKVGRGITAEIYKLERVEIGSLRPIIRPGLEDRFPAYVVLHQLERPGAVRSCPELAAFRGVEDQERVVEQVLRNGKLRLLAIQAHRMIIHFLDRICVPERGTFVVHKIALQKAYQ